MSNELLVNADDGHNVKINAIEAFELDDYPGKKYVAYTFVGGESDRVYISILEKSGDGFNLMGIPDEKEFNKAKETFEELVED